MAALRERACGGSSSAIGTETPLAMAARRSSVRNFRTRYQVKIAASGTENANTTATRPIGSILFFLARIQCLFSASTKDTHGAAQMFRVKNSGGGRLAAGIGGALYGAARTSMDSSTSRSVQPGVVAAGQCAMARNVWSPVSTE